ncbi:hypothetical protein AAG906_005744 [Vitis piasezkii]
MVESHLKKLDKWVIRQVPREENGKADALAEIVSILPIKKAVMLPVYLKVVPQSHLSQFSIPGKYQETRSKRTNSTYKQHASL